MQRHLDDHTIHSLLNASGAILTFSQILTEEEHAKHLSEETREKILHHIKREAVRISKILEAIHDSSAQPTQHEMVS